MFGFLSSSHRKAKAIAVSQLNAAAQAVREQAPVADVSPRSGELRTAAALFKNDLYTKFTSSTGIDYASTLGALGAVAGFSCSVATVELHETGSLIAVRGNDGHTYYFGSKINHFLFEGPESIWALARARARALGASSTLDHLALAARISAGAGNNEYGSPKLPAGHTLRVQPLLAVRFLWPQVATYLETHIKDWNDAPVLLAYVIQDVLTDAKDKIAPADALAIAMECAMPMAHIGPHRFVLEHA